MYCLPHNAARSLVKMVQKNAVTKDWLKHGQSAVSFFSKSVKRRNKMFDSLPGDHKAMIQTLVDNMAGVATSFTWRLFLPKW